MSHLKTVKDELIGQGIDHFIIFSSDGDVKECKGDFVHPEKQLLSYTIMQQSSLLLSAKSETLRKITMSLDTVQYTATTVQQDDEVYGVVTKSSIRGTSLA